MLSKLTNRMLHRYESIPLSSMHMPPNSFQFKARACLLKARMV